LAIAKGEADLAAGRFTTIENDDDLTAFFAKL
jgi:predicted transcriptional regulator